MSATQRYLVITASTMLVFVLILVFNDTTTESGLMLAKAAPVVTPTCLTHTTVMTLSISDTSPKVGDTVAVTCTLANEGCSNVGLLEYTVSIQSNQFLPVLVPNPPKPISHSLSIAPGQSDSAEFILQVIGSGQVTLTSSSSFEVHLGYPGPAYWAGDSTGPLTITVPSTDTEVLVLQQVAHKIGCFPDIVIEDTTYRFVCIFAAGHSLDTRIQRFANESEAQTAFEAARGPLALEPFHCYSAYQWSHEQEIVPMHQQGHSWIADRWIITAHSVEDTGIPIVPSPVTVSEAVYSASIMNRLVQACDIIYLPLIRKSQ